MKLMTKAIAAKLAKADKALVESGMKKEAEEIVVKYFNPVGAGTWYITSATPLDEYGEIMLGPDGKPDYSKAYAAADWHMFGYMDLGYGGELGYVMLSELESYKGALGLGIERDLWFDRTLKEVMAKAA